VLCDVELIGNILLLNESIVSCAGGIHIVATQCFPSTCIGFSEQNGMPGEAKCRGVEQD